MSLLRVGWVTTIPPPHTTTHRSPQSSTSSHCILIHHPTSPHDNPPFAPRLQFFIITSNPYPPSHHPTQQPTLTICRTPLHHSTHPPTLHTQHLQLHLQSTSNPPLHPPPYSSHHHTVTHPPHHQSPNRNPSYLLVLHFIHVTRTPHDTPVNCT